MTERIVDYLSALVSTVGDIDTVHCLTERRTINNADNNKTEIPYVYATGGNYTPVEVDGGSVSYWRLGSPISMTEGEGFSVPKPLSATYPLRFFAIVNRDNINPLTYSQDVANVLQQENSTDLRTQLGAKRVKITVNAVETETSKLWREEFRVPVEDLHYTRAMIAIDVTVNVVANRECWVNCDSYPDILQGFPWCSETEATIDRLTPEQIACVENYLCEIVPCEDATYTNSNGSYSGSVASGANLDIPNIDFTDSDGTTTSVPSVQNIVATPIPPCADATVQLNGTTVGTVPSGDSDSFTVNLDGSPSGVWDGTAWQVTSTPCADATVELNGVEMATILSGDTENISIRQSSGATEVGSKQGVHWRIDDSAISINGSPVADVKAEDSLDIDVTQDGSPVGSWNGSAWIVPAAIAPSLSIEVYSDAGYTVPVTTLNYGATAYIKLTPTGITPTTYSFFFGNGTKNAPQVTQVGNTLAWVVSITGTITISATATQGTDATADATPFTLTSTLVITKGISFDGVNDFAVTGLPKIDSATALSISFRFKMNSTSGKTSLYSFAAFNQSGRATQEMYYESNAFIFLSVNAYSFAQTLPWTGDTNSHVFTMRYNSTVNAVEIFIDGVSIGVCAQVVTAGGYIAGLWSLVLGRAFNFSSYGNVKMTDLRVFGHYLTTGEIATLQTAGAAVGNEVVWFPFALESIGTTSFATDIVTGYQLAMYNITAPNGIVSYP